MTADYETFMAAYAGRRLLRGRDAEDQAWADLRNPIGNLVFVAVSGKMRELGCDEDEAQRIGERHKRCFTAVANAVREAEPSNEAVAIISICGETSTYLFEELLDDHGEDEAQAAADWIYKHVAAKLQGAGDKMLGALCGELLIPVDDKGRTLQ